MWRAPAAASQWQAPRRLGHGTQGRGSSQLPGFEHALAFTQSMKLQVADGILYPDVVVTCGKALAGDEQIVADPRLVIEVLSPSTKGYDKRDKFILYRSLSALREHVLIDPADRRVEVFTLASASAWTLVDQTGSGQLTLSSIDLTVPMAAVFKGIEQAD